MAKVQNIRLECHVRFNRRNPRHVDAAAVLASVEKQYKSSFIALAIEHYMKTHPIGISQVELLDMYRQSDRTYQPKTPIAANISNASERTVLTVPSAKVDSADAAETSSAIDKAMDFYNV